MAAIFFLFYRFRRASLLLLSTLVVGCAPIGDFGRRTVENQSLEAESEGDGISDSVDEETLGEDGRSGPDVKNGVWDFETDPGLPMAGIFYGNYEVGLQTANSRIAVEHSRRFRAEMDGNITAVRYNNRTLLDANISGRCIPSRDPNSRWCACVKANLDRYTCGYTLGNSYSVGNGGLITIEVREDDGSPEHLPSKEVLARTSAFVPMNMANELYPKLQLIQPAKLVAGKLYHLVFLNSNPPKTCGFGGNSIAKAKGCPKNQGAIGLNGILLGDRTDSGGLLDPFRGKSGAVFHRNSSSAKWTLDKDNLSWYEVKYQNGPWLGDSHTAYNSRYTGKQVINGNRVARQRFMVKDASRNVNGLWVHFGHDGRANGAPMNAVVKDSNGKTLATGQIASSKYCRDKAKGLDSAATNCRAWGYTDLSDNVIFNLNQTYSVELQTANGGGFILATNFAHSYRPWLSESRNDWEDSQAEVSTNGGSSWGPFVGNGDNYKDRDMSLLFTIEGMPKTVP